MAAAAANHVIILGQLTAAQSQRVRAAIAAALGSDGTDGGEDAVVQTVTFPPPARDDRGSGGGDGGRFLQDVHPARPAMLAMATSMDGLCRKLHHVAKLELKLNKAMSAIQQYHKQQRETLENFTTLSTKYSQLKANMQTVLWTHMPRLEGFHSIPALDPALEESDSRVGPYAVGKLLGTGHFANVREVVAAEGRERVVLKAIDKAHVKSAHCLQRVAHEIEALTRLRRHPNIIHLHTVLHGKRFLYLVCERMATDLYELIGEHPEGMDGPLAKRIISPILEAVVFIHAHGFLHRDLKPENILLDRSSPAMETFTVKVCDFGLCCPAPAAVDALLTDFCGSPGFICPEMVVEKRYQGRKADFFSAGCILLELLLPAKHFSSIWMRTFRDDCMADSLHFKHRLRLACAEAEAVLRGKLSPEHADLLELAVGLVKVDAFKRFSTAEVQRFLGHFSGEATFGSSSSLLSKGEEEEEDTAAAAAVAAAGQVEEKEFVAELDALAIDDERSEKEAAILQASPPHRPATGRLSPCPSTGGPRSLAARRAISPVPSVSRGLALAPEGGAAGGGGQPSTPSSSSSYPSPSKPRDKADAGAGSPDSIKGSPPAPPFGRPSGLIISPPKAAAVSRGLGGSGSGSSGGVRSSLRAQALLGNDYLPRQRGKDMRPESPGTPLASPMASSECFALPDGLSSPSVGTPVGSPSHRGGDS